MSSSTAESGKEGEVRVGGGGGGEGEEQKPGSAGYEGGCHCGYIKFRATLSPPLPEYEVLWCNCSVCSKLGYLLVCKFRCPDPVRLCLAVAPTPTPTPTPPLSLFHRAGWETGLVRMAGQLRHSLVLVPPLFLSIGTNKGGVGGGGTEGYTYQPAK